MNLFILLAENNGPDRRFLDDAVALVPKDKLEVFDGFAAFAERLRKPRDPCCAVLVLGPSHDDLTGMVSLRGFLKDAKILLVLADQSEETIALAHKILPTYISDLENSTSGIVSVLKQMTRDARAQEGEN